MSKSVILTFRDNYVVLGDQAFTYNAPRFDAEHLVLKYLLQKHSLRDSKYSRYEFERYIKGLQIRGLVDCDNYSEIHNLYYQADTNIDLASAVQDSFLIFVESDKDIVKFSKYQIKDSDFQYISEMTVEFNDGLVYKNPEIVSLETFLDFFDNSIISSGYMNALEELIFNNHVNSPALTNLKLEYLNFMRDISFYERHSIRTRLTFYHYFADFKVPYLFEFNRQNNIPVKNIFDENPVFSGKPYNDVRTQYRLSSVGMELVHIVKGRDNLDYCIEVMSELEQMPAVGVNGLKYIREIIELLEKIKKAKIEGFHTYEFRYIRAYEHLKWILETYDISLKVLIERAVRSMFTDNCSIDSYLERVVSYSEMRDMLNLEKEKKLPKNVLELHDILQAQLKEIEIKGMEEAFKRNAIEYQKMANAFNEQMPDDKFIIIAPESATDLMNEGQKMHHCVGSYIRRFANGYSKIFFVRLKENIDEPFATIELDPYNHLSQASAKFNKTVSPETMKFIKKFESYMEGQ